MGVPCIILVTFVSLELYQNRKFPRRRVKTYFKKESKTAAEQDRNQRGHTGAYLLKCPLLAPLPRVTLLL